MRRTGPTTSRSTVPQCRAGKSTACSASTSARALWATRGPSEPVHRHGCTQGRSEGGARAGPIFPGSRIPGYCLALPPSSAGCLLSSARPRGRPRGHRAGLAGLAPPAPARVPASSAAFLLLPSLLSLPRVGLLSSAAGWGTGVVILKCCTAGSALQTMGLVHVVLIGVCVCFVCLGAFPLLARGGSCALGGGRCLL